MALVLSYYADMSCGNVAATLGVRRARSWALSCCAPATSCSTSGANAAPPAAAADGRRRHMIHFDEMACLLYLEGQLEPGRAREMTVHIKDCAACRTLLHALDRESHLLTAALTEDNESMPTRLLSTRGWGVAQSSM
jgi:hypothetical protein